MTAILGVATAHDLANVGAPDWTLHELEWAWALHGFEPTTDTWLVETSDGSVVGCGWISTRPTLAPELVAFVHPEHRGRGLGKLLAGLGEARAREIVDAPGGDHPRVLANWIDEPDRAAAALLTARGYRLVRTSWRMSITLHEPPASPRWPPGVELRPMRPDVDDRAVHETATTAFRDHWNSAPLPFDDWRRLRIRTSHFDASLWHLAWDGEQMVGVSLCGIDDTGAWVETLGVLRDARGKGLGEALLLHSFGEFWRRDIGTVLLGVDSQNPTGATRLYERAGMIVDRRYDRWELAL